MHWYSLKMLCLMELVLFQWSHCLDRPAVGSIYSIAWSSDGTQLAAACANGQVLFAHIIDRYAIHPIELLVFFRKHFRQYTQEFFNLVHFSVDQKVAQGALHFLS